MSFWPGKRVLVTGADGFLGANLTKRLLAAKAAVITLARQPAHPHSLFALERLDKKVTKRILGTVEDFDLVNKIIASQKVEIIYHLAALSLVEIGRDNPIKTFAVNIGGTWNVLEAARQNMAKQVIAVSTTHVYGDNPNLPYKETYYPQPSRPYETSKACADLLAQCYADSYRLSVVIPRFVNLYGPGDLNFTRIVPKVIRTVLRGENPQLWQSQAVRDFLYIDDAVAALIRLAETNTRSFKGNSVINFGSGRPISIIDLAQKITALAGHGKQTVVLQPQPADRAKEIIEQYVSIEKARTELNWQPTTTLEQGLADTIAWYRAHPQLLL